MKKYILTLFIGIGLFFAVGANADTFGYESIGGSNWDSGGDARMTGSLFTPASGGTVDSMTIYQKTGSSNHFKGIVVLHSNLNMVSNGISNSTLPSGGNYTWAWTTCSFGTSPSISGSTGYVLMHLNESYSSLKYDGGSTNQGHDDTSNNFSSPTNPTDASHNDYKYSIYATYSVSSEPEEKDRQDIIWFE